MLCLRLLPPAILRPSSLLIWLLRRSANWAAKDGVALIDNLFLGKVLGAGMQMSVAVLREAVECPVHPFRSFVCGSMKRTPQC